MLKIRINQAVFADAVRKAAEAWTTRRTDGLTAEAKAEGGDVVVTISSAPPGEEGLSASSGQALYRFEAGTTTVRISRVTTSAGAPGSGEASTSGDDAAAREILELASEIMARGDRSPVIVETEPIEPRR